MFRLHARQDRGSSQQEIAVPFSFPAPIGGLNAHDSVAMMPSADAVTLDNWIAKTESVIMRGGAISWATPNVEGLQSTDTVESLLVYEPASGSRALFAFTDAGDAFNVTSQGSASLTALSGLTNGRWQGVNFANSGGTFLIAVNGADSMESYNGSAWTATPTVNGGAKNTSDFIHVNVFKFRVFMIEKASLLFWYNTSAGAFLGTYAAYETRQLFTKGGFLMAMGTWTADGGSGPDDRAAFITSEGEIAVFQGSDPGNSSAWGLVGVYFIGKPIGRRCFIKYGSDLLVLTERGLFPMIKALSAGEEIDASALTAKIDSLFNRYAQTFATTFGWDVNIHPRQVLGIVNVPGTPKVQFVWNLLTGAWSRFTGWSASCFAVFNSELYYGFTGGVAKALSGQADFGNSVTATMQTAFNYFSSAGEPKQISLLRATTKSNGPFGYLIGATVDFDLLRPPGVITAVGSTAALWDTAIWDSALWSGDDVVTQDWDTVAANDGFCVSSFYEVASKTTTVELLSFDYKILVGSGI